MNINTLIHKFLVIFVLVSSCLGTSYGQEKRLFRDLIPGQYTATAIVSEAKKWEGKHYRYGQSRQCANWVGRIINDSGGNTPPHYAMARNWLSWGRQVSLIGIRPGDVVITWRGSRSGTSGHILIYVGNGQCIHRPTQSRAVCKTPLAYYEGKILGVRRK